MPTARVIPYSGHRSFVAHHMSSWGPAGAVPKVRCSQIELVDDGRPAEIVIQIVPPHLYRLWCRALKCERIVHRNELVPASCLEEERSSRRATDVAYGLDRPHGCEPAITSLARESIELGSTTRHRVVRDESTVPDNEDIGPRSVLDGR